MAAPVAPPIVTWFNSLDHLDFVSYLISSAADICRSIRRKRKTSYAKMNKRNKLTNKSKFMTQIM